MAKHTIRLLPPILPIFTSPPPASHSPTFNSLWSKTLDLLHLQTSLLQAALLNNSTHSRRVWKKQKKFRKNMKTAKSFTAPHAPDPQSLNPPTPKIGTTSTSLPQPPQFTNLPSDPPHTFKFSHSPAPSPQPNKKLKKSTTIPPSTLLTPPLLSLPQQPLTSLAPPRPLAPLKLPLPLPTFTNPLLDSKRSSVHSESPESIASFCLRDIPSRPSHHNPKAPFTFIPQSVLSQSSLSGVKYGPIVQSWSADQVHRFFTRLGRSDIADILKTFECTGTKLFDLSDEEYLEFEGILDSEVQTFILAVLSYFYGYRV